MDLQQRTGDIVQSIVGIGFNDGRATVRMVGLGLIRCMIS